MSEVQPSSRLEEAARWFAAQRRGVMAVEERARYETWMGDPVNRSALACLERSWAATAAAGPRFLETARPPQPGQWSRLARPALLAAMCAVSLGIGIWSYSDDTGFFTTLNWTDR